MPMSPTDVQTLRDSVRYRLADPLGDPGFAYIRFAADEAMTANHPAGPDDYVLHSDGRLQAISPNIGLLATALACEHAEPGFIARIMDTHTPCDVASLAPDLLHAEAERRRCVEAAIRARNFADAETARQTRISRRTDVANLTLDDL